MGFSQILCSLFYFLNGILNKNRNAGLLQMMQQA